ncbi:MAG: tetratricopeptide repeat protein [Candidatus Hermodarchaeota archaeon]
MPHTDSNTLILAEKLLSEGKFDEALQIINTLEKQKILESSDWFEGQLLKSSLLNKQGKYEEALELAKLILDETRERENYLQSVDALTIMADALTFLGRLDEGLEILIQGTDALKTLSQVQKSKSPRRIFFRRQDRKPESTKKFSESSEEIARRKALLLYQQGIIYGRKGNLDQALEHHERGLVLKRTFSNKQDIAHSLNNIGIIYWQKGSLNKALKYYEESLEFYEELSDKQNIAKSLNNIGIVHMTKGDLDQALKCLQQSLRLIKKIGSKHHIAATLGNIGEIYYQQGDLNQALNYYQQSLTLREEIKDNLQTSEALFHLIAVAIDKSSPELIEEYLPRLQEINNQEKNKIISQWCRVAEALELKMSKRPRNLGKAAELLEEVVEDEIVDHKLMVTALLNLCDLLLIELRTSGDSEVLNEVKNFVSKLLDIANQQRSHSLLAETYLLQSKLALLELNIQEARRLLTQAQLLADERGLQRLAMKISNEHDSLLDQLSMWEDFIGRNASLSERAELAQLEDLVVRMVRKKTIDLTEIREEEPVILLILHESGLSAFSKTFLPESSLDEQLMAGLLTAIRVFSREAFSQNIDRVKIEDYTLLMRSEEPFLICYAFKGRSYAAHQKFTHFVRILRNTTALWEPLLEFAETGRVLETIPKTSLEDLLTEVFSI